MIKNFIPCHVPRLSAFQAEVALSRLRDENPKASWPGAVPGYLAVDTKRWWPKSGKVFPVAFAKGTSNALRNKILLHANEWSKYANVKFVHSSTDPLVRVDFGRSGYWSYLGTDILGISPRQPTMNLEGFTVNSSDAEYRRVVRHEFGHTLGFPHEHMRKELVDRLNKSKTIAYFRKTQGWNATEVLQQVLTPLDEASIRGTPHADDTSIMCYQLPGSITQDGNPIKGGNDINELDSKFIGEIYPLVTPEEPSEPVSDGVLVSLEIKGVTYAGTVFPQVHEAQTDLEFT